MLSMDQVTAIAIQDAEEIVTHNERNLRVHRMAHIMVAYARKVEADIYERANCRFEYRLLLDKEFHMTPIELEIDNVSGFVLPLDQVTAISIQSTKVWHESVTPDIRSYIVRCLAHCFVGYARKVEADIYILAEGRIGYRALIIKEICSMREKLENRTNTL